MYDARRDIQRTTGTENTHVNHSMRKTGATIARNAGVSDVVIGYLGNWVTDRMHEHYLRVIPPGDVSRLACEYRLTFCSCWYLFTTSISIEVICIWIVFIDFENETTYYLPRNVHDPHDHEDPEVQQMVKSLWPQLDDPAFYERIRVKSNLRGQEAADTASMNVFNALRYRIQQNIFTQYLHIIYSDEQLLYFYIEMN